MATTLAEAESLINADYLAENQPSAEDWFNTVLAGDSIITHKLYKERCKSVHAYIDKKRKDLSNANIWRTIPKRFRNRDSVNAQRIPLIFPDAPISTNPAPMVYARPEKRPRNEEPVAAEPPPESGRQLRNRLRMNHAGQDTESEPEESAGGSNSAAAKQKGIKHFQVEWNTYGNFADRIHEFAQAFGGQDLDPCGNPESPIVSRWRYRRIGNVNNDFIDALGLPRWGVPGEGDDKSDPTTWSQTVNLLYINPPYKRVDLEAGAGKDTRACASLFALRLLDAMEKGHVKDALYLLPMYMEESMETLFPKGLSCFIIERLKFTVSTHDFARSGRNTNNISRAIGNHAIVYLEAGKRTKEDHFVQVFGEIGIIPGFNMQIYSGNLRP
ncbi:hypothetical protein HDV00_007401 [Rhizophlyctis rosea]|nr:hypothetical protein HDV00_007401 [Rhizophlyctis rosea]